MVNTKVDSNEVKAAFEKLKARASNLDLPDLIGLFRRRLGLNQFEFSKSVDIPNYVLSRYETREREIPLDHQLRIISFLNARLQESEAL